MLLTSSVTFLILIVDAIINTHQTSDVIMKSVELIDSLPISPRISINLCWRQKQLKMLLKNLTNKRFVNLLAKNNTQRKLQNNIYVIDLNCNNSRTILTQAEKLQLFKAPTKWILLGKASQVPNLYFSVDSQIFIIDPTSRKISTIYKYSSTDTYLLKDSLEYFDNFTTSKRTNLMRRNITVSVVITNSDSLNHLWDYKDTHIDAISKLNYILVNILMDYLNASRQFIIRSTWGYKNLTTGFYNGMVGDLQEGKADLGGTPLFFTSERVAIVDYIAATTPTHMKFIFRAPPLSYVTNVFTLPFESSVWHYCFIMIASVVIFIYFIVKWEWAQRSFRQEIVDEHPDALRPRIFDVIMMEIGAITQQGSNAEPQSIAGRIITIFTFTTLMFLYTSYSANIVALLQSTTDSIITLEDLLNSRIKLGVEDIVYARYYFENAQDPTRRAIYQQKVAPKTQKSNFMKAEEGISRVQGGFFAFHVELSTGYKIISNTFQEGEKCGLKEIEYMNFIEPWIATQKKSVYAEIFKIGMKKMQEFGIQSREVRNIYTRKPKCHTGGSNFDSVGIIDCYSAFLLYGVGVSIAILLLLAELLVNYAKISTKCNCIQSSCKLDDKIRY